MCVVLASVDGRRSIRSRSDEPHDSVGVIQGALLGFMALVLAFGLSLAIGRYENRRAATAAEATALDTTYLRAQTLAEPMRTESLSLLRDYTDLGIRIAETVPAAAASAPRSLRATRSSRSSGGWRDRRWTAHPSTAHPGSTSSHSTSRSTTA